MFSIDTHREAFTHIASNPSPIMIKEEKKEINNKKEEEKKF